MLNRTQNSVQKSGTNQGQGRWVTYKEVMSMNRDNTLVRIMNGREIHPCTLDRGTEGMKTAFDGGLCVPYAICEWMPEAVDGVALCDPKGAGVSTTSQRYSRKEYRQTDVFPIPSPIPTFWFHCMESSNCGSQSTWKIMCIMRIIISILFGCLIDCGYLCTRFDLPRIPFD